MDSTVLTVGTSKGGVGKSTLAINLASEIAERGETVILLDIDPNQPITMWAEVAKRNDTMPKNISVVPANRKSVDKQIKENKGEAQNIIVDLAGTADMSVAFAALQTDFFILPFRPSIVDINVSQTVTDYLSQINLPYAAIATQTQVAIRPQSEIDTIRAMRSLGVPLFETQFIFRNAFRIPLNDATTLADYQRFLVSELDRGGLPANLLRRYNSDLTAVEKARDNMDAILHELALFMSGTHEVTEAA